MGGGVCDHKASGAGVGLDPLEASATQRGKAVGRGVGHLPGEMEEPSTTL